MENKLRAEAENDEQYFNNFHNQALEKYLGAKVHEVKCWVEFEQPVIAGLKKFELRVDDRNYKQGEYLRQRFWNPETKQYTGTEVLQRIDYILKGGSFGLDVRMVCMSVTNIDLNAQQSQKDFYKIGNFDEKCDDACKFNCTKGNTQEAECLKDEQTQFTFDPPNQPKRYTVKDVLEFMKYGFEYHRDSMNDNIDVPNGNKLQYLVWYDKELDAETAIKESQQSKEGDTNMFDVEILFYAFRYALGRKTYAVSDVAKKIINNWGKIDNNTRLKIHKEIKKAIENGRAGMEMDISEWNKILELPL